MSHAPIVHYTPDYDTPSGIKQLDQVLIDKAGNTMGDTVATFFSLCMMLNMVKEHADPSDFEHLLLRLLSIIEALRNTDQKVFVKKFSELFLIENEIDILKE